MRLALVAATLLLATAGPVLADVEESEHFESVDAMTAAADAVVLGQVVRVGKGPGGGTCGFTPTIVRVDEVLAGGVGAFVREITLEYFDCGPGLTLGDQIPAERGVFFLRNKGVELRRRHPEAPADRIDAAAGVWRLVVIAGTIVDRGGQAHVPETSNSAWLGAWEDRSFKDLLAEVRGAAPMRPVEAPGGTAPLGRTPAIIDLPIEIGAALALAALLGLVAGVRRVRHQRALPPAGGPR
ncbi:MAG: hypothetical protein ABIR11_04750 [Candidatus Limnocylindrales bacterium]